MDSYRMREEYDRAFAVFLEHTDEKERLFDAIAERIRVGGAISLLDIGAGNGDLAIPLARLVGRYLAVEQKPTFLKVLQRAGLRVVGASFPFVIEEQFDLVLVSHALPYKAEDYRPFLDQAWVCVAPGGSLLGITYHRDQGEWRDLLIACGFPEKQSEAARFEGLKTYLSRLGQTTVDVVTTHVCTSSVADMLSALSFVYSDGEPGKVSLFRKKSADLTRSLDTHYHNAEGYRFPFQHVFLQTQKG